VYLRIDVRKNIVSFGVNDATEEQQYSSYVEKLSRLSDRIYPFIFPPSNSNVSISMTML
jgi:hypothetical protein